VRQIGCGSFTLLARGMRAYQAIEVSLPDEVCLHADAFTSISSCKNACRLSRRSARASPNAMIACRKPALDPQSNLWPWKRKTWTPLVGIWAAMASVSWIAPDPSGSPIERCENLWPKNIATDHGQVRRRFARFGFLDHAPHPHQPALRCVDIQNAIGRGLGRRHLHRGDHVAADFGSKHQGNPLYFGLI
jgi:hypothetical protein